MPFSGWVVKPTVLAIDAIVLTIKGNKMLIGATSWRELKGITSYPWNKVIIEIENLLVFAMCRGLNLGNGYKSIALVRLDDRTIMLLACYGSYMKLHVTKLHRTIHTHLQNECIYNRWNLSTFCGLHKCEFHSVLYLCKKLMLSE